MTIELTEAAAQHLRRELTKRGHGTGLSVATKKSGGGEALKENRKIKSAAKMKEIMTEYYVEAKTAG